MIFSISMLILFNKISNMIFNPLSSLVMPFHNE
ncbi:hypothetical protein BAN_0900023 (plasmid) [Borrelia anserina BA2]|uniref:Uncharacterized protein n=1 Tax=Borrelia anserina BA2 TaxID=1313293 RepID=W5SPA9_BORAN|nr:hypothetical protein BAN_0900023 [Borrelia anserina BA2]